MNVIKGLLDKLRGEDVSLSTEIKKSEVEAISANDPMLSDLPPNKVKRLITAFVGSPRHTWKDIIRIIVNDHRTFYTLPFDPDMRNNMFKSFLILWGALSYRQDFAEEALRHRVISLILQEANRRDFDANTVELCAEAISSIMSGVNSDNAIFQEAMLGMPWLFLLADVRNLSRQRILALIALQQIMRIPEHAMSQARPTTARAKAEEMNAAIIRSIMHDNNGRGLDVLLELAIKDKNKEVKELVNEVIKALSDINPDLVKARIMQVARINSLPSSARRRNQRFVQPPRF